MVEGTSGVESLTGPVGLVLAGAVAQGGFEAGALGMLAQKNPTMRIRRIAGTSSGALNAAVAAVGVATRQFGKAAEVLQKMWAAEACLGQIAKMGPHSLWEELSIWLHLRGVLETTQLENLVKEAIAEVISGWDGKTTDDVTLTLVTTNLNATEPRNGVPLARFEQPVVFRKKDLLDRECPDRLAKAAAASATFPVLFAPTLFADRSGEEGGGAVKNRPNPCIDGGAVNNAPIGYVLREPQADGRRAAKSESPDVQSVIVVTTEFSQLQWEKELGGLQLAARIASALIDERIAYDLAEALDVNARYAAIVKALAAANIVDGTRQDILVAAGLWPVDLYLVQPNPALPGDSFSGFLNPKQRAEDIQAGRVSKMLKLPIKFDDLLRS